VWKAIRKLGYERNAVASSLRTDRTYMVMLVTPDIANPFWPEVARGLQDTLEEPGYSVVLGNGDWDERREVRLLKTTRRNRFDGIAINPTTNSRELQAIGIPAVILGVRDGFPNFDMVGADSYSGTLEALSYLYRLGHRRIGFIRGHRTPVSGQARDRAYQEFIEQRRLPLDESLVVEAPYDLKGGRKAMQSLLGLRRRPTAVLAANDILAIGAMQATATAGLNIPADLSIMGMDDIYPASLTTPPLTTMAKPKYDIGCQAARFLLERIEGSASRAGRRCVLPCQLVERGSTAPPPA